MLFGDIALELASIGFTVRIVSLCGHRWLVSHLMIFFVACLSVQWWLLFDASNKSIWQRGIGCDITRAVNSFSNIGYMVNTGYSLVLLALASWDYACPLDDVLRPSTGSLKELFWFGVAFLASCMNAIFIRINLNPVMEIITIFPCTIAISIALGRVLRWKYSNQTPTTLPETTEHIQLTATRSPHMRTRFGFRTRWLALGRRTHGGPEGSNFQRLYSAPASQTGSYIGTSDNVNSTRPSSIVLPSLISPSSTYDPAHGLSIPLDSASESTNRGDRYDLGDVQLEAAERRSL